MFCNTSEEDQSLADHVYMDAVHSRCMRGVQVMRRVHHPNTVQFLGGCTKQEPYLLVTELMSGGSLADAFRSQRVFALRRALEIAVDCARGLAYLHNKKHPSGVVHRDLKPANLMVAGSSYHTRQESRGPGCVCYTLFCFQMFWPLEDMS